MKLKNIGLFFLILGAIAFIAYKGLNSLEKIKSDDEIRTEKLTKGECEFSKIDIDNLAIQGYSKPLKVKMSPDSLKYVDSENTNIFYKQYGQSVYMTVIKADHTSPVKFLSGEKVVFAASWKLNDFAKAYPLSYNCREGADGPLAQHISLQIDNSNTNSPVRYMKFFFSVAETVRAIEIGYQ
jgi:hypothetical protein